MSVRQGAGFVLAAHCASDPGRPCGEHLSRRGNQGARSEVLDLNPGGITSFIVCRSLLQAHTSPQAPTWWGSGGVALELAGSHQSSTRSGSRVPVPPAPVVVPSIGVSATGVHRGRRLRPTRQPGNRSYRDRGHPDPIHLAPYVLIDAFLKREQRQPSPGRRSLTGGAGFDVIADSSSSTTSELRCRCRPRRSRKAR